MLVESVQVLSSKRLYNRSHTEIRAFLTEVFDSRGLRLPRATLYRRALDLYAETNIDFGDALNVAHVERAGWASIVSFDQHYDRIPWVLRREP